MMNINMTLYGQLVLLTLVITGIVAYYLAKRKTTTPIATTIIVMVASVIPPLALIMLFALTLKNDRANSKVPS